VIAVHYKFEDKGIVVETDRGIMDPKELIARAIPVSHQAYVSVIGVEETGLPANLGFLAHLLSSEN